MSKIVQIPSRLYIGGYEFALRLLPPDDPLLKVVGGEDAEDGMMISDPGQYAICISSTLGTRRRLIIVLHEITHAINWVRDIEDGVMEESIAEIHGEAWAQFYLDNPRFVNWLVYTLARIRSGQRAGIGDGESILRKGPNVYPQAT